MEQASQISPKGLATREKIFNSSLMLINTKGYDQTTILDICCESGIAVGTFYHYFKSKQDILFRFVEQENEKLIEYFDSLDKSSYSNAMLKIIEFQINYILCKGPAFLSQLIFTGFRFGSSPQSIAKFSLGDIVRECIEGGQKKGEFSCDISTSIACDMLMGMLLLYIQDWCTYGERYNIREKILHGFHSFVTIISAQ